VCALGILALQDLTQLLPFPLILIGNQSAAGFANDRYAEVFLAGQLDIPDLQQLARSPGSAWQPVKLRRRDGRDLVARARAVALADGVLLVFDEGGDPALMHENERLQQRITELEGRTATDALTGAWNRMHFERMVEVEIRRAMRLGRPVTMVLVDIDRFKRVNDLHGHLTGDHVLKQFVGRVQERLRADDALFRWGGDEFIVLAASVGYRGGAALAEGLRKTIADLPFATVGTITASLGVAEHMEGESAENWFLRTDQALYAAKEAGRNRIHVDRQGSSDLHPGRAGTGVLRLDWLEAYECGESTLDAQHRELFDLGNALMAAAIEQYSQPRRWRVALDSMLAHLAKHFQDEEVLLSQHGYHRLAEHQRVHADLLSRADELKVAVDDEEATLGHLVNFLVNDVIALHILKTDRDFHSLLRGESGAGADRIRS
jgi:diguanylate cyclase (GGDEF)-like protein/hemerythrin-like metal-binding protein